MAEPASGAGEAMPSPPHGFVAATARGRFSTHIGPYFHHPDGAQAFFAMQRHCNSVGLIHGGMLSAFLDGVLASAAAHGTGMTPVTMHLSIDFLDMGRAGEWVIGEASLTRASAGVAFAEGRAHVDGRGLARATGLFKLMRRRIS
ncbi:MAG TPA: PaaI family thioesterase [Caulobacteraceae bacterium]|nr:PaaI family thioesterase [Caulobacteraceae bacterium]